MAIAATMAAMVFQACSSGKAADAGEILSTVPSDVSMVAVINSQQLLEKAGCKVDGDKISPSKELLAAVLQIKDEKVKNFVSTLVGGESGIDASVIVLFREGYNTFLTGIAADPAKFKATIEKHAGSKFTAKDGIDIAANVAVADNRFWVNMTGNSVDAGDIRHFKSLSSSQSFLQNSYAQNLTSIVKDVECWGNLNGLLNTAGLDFQTKATYQVALQTIFEDPSAFTLSINADKGEVSAQAFVLNSKGKNAKYLLPSDKLDVTAISSIGGTADMLMAIDVPGKLIEKLKKETESKAPSIFGVYLQQLGCVDGTFAIAYPTTSDKGDFKGIISTSGKDVSALTSFLSSAIDAKTVINGNQIDFSKGQISGSTSVAEMANSFKGAIAGLVINDPEQTAHSNPFDKTSVMLFTDGNSIRFEVKASNSQKKENAVLLLLEQIKK